MALQMDLNKDRYVSLLEKLIGEVEFLQNNPPKFVPQEDRAIKHLLEALKPYTVENGGVLKVEHVWYVEGRGNLTIEYTPEGATGTVAFVGSHLDVVPANPETWERNPFKLVVEGDKLYGRGTTDCLGHVALITELFIQLAEKKPKLKYSVAAIFIACEENNTIPGVGVDKLMECGKLDHLKNGPIYWVDSADCNPCMATAAITKWTIKFKGRLFHSGLPHKGINSIELASEAMAYIQRRFYEDFPAHPSEERYHFATPSTMKPTQVTCSEGSFNQIPPWTEMTGDIRLTPFYNIYDCMKKVEDYVKELNDDITQLPTRGPCSKYEISLEEGEFRGELELTFEGVPFKYMDTWSSGWQEDLYTYSGANELREMGIACNLDSPAFKKLDEATKEIIGESKPYSICGSLPLVGDLQEAGFDVQICGYGHSSVYHGDNEYCTLSVMEKAFKLLCTLLNKFNQ